MAAIKHYLILFITTAAPENACGQDALEWAVYHGQLKLTYELETDLRQAAQQYDTIIEAYQRSIRAESTYATAVDGVLNQIAA